MIGMGGERGSGISVLMVRQDDEMKFFCQSREDYRPHWYTEFAWYSFNDSHRICLNGFEYSSEIHSFWSYQFVEVLAIGPKFLEPSAYCTVINSALTFHTEDVLGCLRDVMTQFEIYHVYIFTNRSDRIWHKANF